MVKIYEVTDLEQKNNDELGFDLVDDTSVWMRNDPEFYRKEYFNNLTQQKDDAINDDLMKEQHPGMPIDIDRQTRVTFGGTKKD